MSGWHKRIGGLDRSAIGEEEEDEEENWLPVGSIDRLPVRTYRMVDGGINQLLVQCVSLESPSFVK